MEERLDGRFTVSLKGREYATWPGVLDLATRSGLRMIEVNILQYPHADNGHVAVCQATVTFEDGRVFTEVGDAGPGNCSAMIAPHAVRMASTRAKGRALRDALNIGQALLEELGPDAQEALPQPRTGTPRAKYDPQDQQSRQPVESALCASCGKEVPEGTATAARKRWGTVLCLEHGKERAAAEREVLTDIRPQPAQLTGA